MYVAGGAGKLFRSFVDNYGNSVVTFSDNRLGSGGVYRHLGFKPTRQTPPNYFYYHKSNTRSMESRIKYQKHKLDALLDTFDSGLTEKENMKINGYFILYDCGNTVYEPTTPKA